MIVVLHERCTVANVGTIPSGPSHGLSVITGFLSCIWLTYLRRNAQLGEVGLTWHKMPRCTAVIWDADFFRTRVAQQHALCHHGEAFCIVDSSFFD
jgi:hypothetical protein